MTKQEQKAVYEKVTAKLDSNHIALLNELLDESYASGFDDGQAETKDAIENGEYDRDNETELDFER